MSRTRQFLTRTLLLALAILLPLAAARAQFPAIPGMQQEPMLRIGFGGGVTVPVSDARDAFKNGVNGEGFIQLRIPGGLPPLRFSLAYQKFNLKDIVGSASTSGSSRAIGGLGGISMDLMRGPLRPYVTASVGAFNIKNEVTVEGASQSQSGTHFAIDGAAGLKLKIGRLDAFAEGHVQNVYTDQGAIDTKSIRSVPVTFGVMF